MTPAEARALLGLTELTPARQVAERFVELRDGLHLPDDAGSKELSLTKCAEHQTARSILLDPSQCELYDAELARSRAADYPGTSLYDAVGVWAWLAPTAAIEAAASGQVAALFCAEDDRAARELLARLRDADTGYLEREVDEELRNSRRVDAERAADEIDELRDAPSPTMREALHLLFSVVAALSDETAGTEYWHHARRAGLLPREDHPDLQRKALWVSPQAPAGVLGWIVDALALGYHYTLEHRDRCDELNEVGIVLFPDGLPGETAARQLVAAHASPRAAPANTLASDAAALAYLEGVPHPGGGDFSRCLEIRGEVRATLLARYASEVAGTPSGDLHGRDWAGLGLPTPAETMVEAAAAVRSAAAQLATHHGQLAQSAYAAYAATAFFDGLCESYARDDVRYCAEMLTAAQQQTPVPTAPEEPR